MRKLIISGIVWTFLLFSLSLQGQTKRIYVAPDDHSDIWWRADLDTYNQAYLTMLDYYINLSDNTLNEPHNYQSRWNCDGSYWMWIYEKSRSPAQFQKLINYIRSGHISMPLNPIPVVLGATPVEAVIRGMLYPGKIEREYGLRLPLAYAMENQTLPLGLATIWSEAGVKYSWKGVCACASSVDATKRDNEIYWMQGLDNSKVLMKWYSLTDYGEIDGIVYPNRGPGGYAEVRYPLLSIDYVDNSLNFKTRYPYPVIGLFGKGWDDLLTLTDEFISVSKSASNANRAVIVSNEIDFFEDFEANYGNEISTQSVSYGNDWELGIAAIQEISSRMKRSTEKLRNAEAIATFAALSDPALLLGKENAKDQSWMNMGLFFDHNIGFPGSYIVDAAAKRTAWQKQLVDGIESYVNSLQSNAVSVLGNSIIKPSGKTRYFVFNSLSWSRTDFADLEYNLQGSVKVIDITNNQEVPSQFIQTEGKTYLRILAKDIPAAGYKVFEIVNQPGETFENAAMVNGNTIENSFYKLTVTEKGSISSIISKKHGNQEFIQTIGGKNANDLGGMVSGSVSVENAGPVSVTLVINSGSILNHTSRVTLFRDIDRIDIHNAINQNFTSTETWSYGFNIPSYTLRHEEIGTILKAKTKANGGHYADKNANYEWLTLNHFADISNNNYGITLSNEDCYFMKMGNSTLTYLDQSTPQISILAGGRINGNGLPDQGGDNSFTQRFALKTHSGYNPASSMRFSLEHQNPIVTGVVNGGNFYPEASMSLLSIDNPDVILWSLKPSEEGIESGIIARLWNLSENTNSFTMGSFYPILSAKNVTLIETPLSSADIQNNKIAGQVNSYGFKTFNFIVNAANANKLIVTPQNRSVGSASGSTAFTVTSNMDWSVTDDSEWLTVIKTDASTISVTYNENTSTSSRNANIVVTGTDGLSQTVTIIQAFANPNLEISPSSISVTSLSGTATFSVAANFEWSVSDDVNWLSATKIDASTIIVTYNENALALSRAANILVTGTGRVNEMVSVIQAAADVVLTVTPGSRSVSSSKGSITFTVTANTDWTVTDDAAWLTSTRTDSVTIDATYDENPSAISRTANIRVTGGGVTEDVTVIQDDNPDFNTGLKDFDVVIYPNPAKNSIALRFNKTIIQEVHVSVTDAVGRSVYLNNYPGSGLNNEIPIDLSFLPSGLYFMSIKAQTITKVLKIIKGQ
jgi:alpha-mannosidase